MGRELKRVALDFKWELDKVWAGFVNPWYQFKEKCPACENGYSPEAKHLNDLWYGYVPFKPEDNGCKPLTVDHPIVWAFADHNVKNGSNYYGTYSEFKVRSEARRLCDLWNGQWCHHLSNEDVEILIEADALRDWTHTWTKDNGWVKKDPPYIPTKEEINDASIRRIGSSSLQWYLAEALCKAIGVSTTCSLCNGDADSWPSKEIKAKCESWEQIEPPVGEGWQVWETVSEGSPITPVFATREALIDHLVTYGTTFEQHSLKKGYTTDAPGWTRPNAEAFVEAEYACSMVGFSGPGGNRFYGANQLADYANDVKLTDGGF